MRIPTITRTEDIHTGSTAPAGPAEGVDGAAQGMTILGAGMQNAARGVSDLGQHIGAADEYQRIQAEKLALKREHQKKQDEALEAAQLFSTVRRDWNDQMRSYAENPSEDMTNIAEVEYDKYVQGLLSKTSSPEVAKELKLKTDDLRLSLVNDAYKIQVVTRQKNFGNNFDQMISNAEDSIYTTKSLNELDAQRELLTETIDKAVATGRIRDPETVQGLRGKVETLSVAWAQANLGTDPKSVLSAVRGEGDWADVMKNVPAHVRLALENRAEHSLESMSKLDNLAIREAYESDKAQRIATGMGNAWNYDAHVQAFGKTSADAAKRDLENASKLFDVSQSLRGATNDEIKQIFEAAKPKSDPLSTTYHEEKNHEIMVQKMIHQALEDKKDDPYSFYAQDPVIKNYVDRFEKDPSPENRSLMQGILLDRQRQDGVPEYALKIMPKPEAEKFIADFNGLTAIGNKTDANGVRDRILQFQDTFKEDIHIALSQLQSVKGGEKVTAKINPLLWHTGNPSLFQGILDSIRKDPEDVDKRFKDVKEKASFYADVNSDPQFAKYSASILGSNTSPEAFSLVNGVREAFTAFSKDYTLNGGKMKDASAAFFGPYSFGTVNGSVYARPRIYTDSQTKTPHVVSDEMARISDNFMKLYPETLDPDKLAPDSILNQFTHFTDQQKHEDVLDALEHNVFWVTSEDETGAYLYTRGTLVGAPRQVKTKDGAPVKVNFEDTYAPREMVPFRRKNTPNFRTTPARTDDTIWDSMFNHNFGS